MSAVIHVSDRQCWLVKFGPDQCVSDALYIVSSKTPMANRSIDIRHKLETFGDCFLNIKGWCVDFESRMV